MNTSQLLMHHDHLCEEARNLMVKKNADYAEESAPFKNFELSERLGLCSTEAGMAIRLSDKIQRLCGFLAGKDLKVKDESVRDTILDAINYLVLIAARLEENKSSEKEIALRDPLGKEEDIVVRIPIKTDPLQEYWGQLVLNAAEALDRKILSTDRLQDCVSKVAPVTVEEVRTRCGQCSVVGGRCAYGRASDPWACMVTKVSCP